MKVDQTHSFSFALARHCCSSLALPLIFGRSVFTLAVAQNHFCRRTFASSKHLPSLIQHSLLLPRLTDEVQLCIRQHFAAFCRSLVFACTADSLPCFIQMEMNKKLIFDFEVRFEVRFACTNNHEMTRNRLITTPFSVQKSNDLVYVKHHLCR
jgi:hypothetical protein